MSEITSIEPQAKNKNRCNVYVDGKFYCGLGLETAVKYRLKAGMQISGERLDEIQLEAEKSRALDSAMTYISASMKTSRRVREFLSAKGYTEAVQNYVAEKLAYYNLLDDYAYCRAYIESAKGKGKRALEADLIRRGAERSAIERALDGVEEDKEGACAAFAKYMRGKTADKQNLYKGFKYLLSKGYSADTAKYAAAKWGAADEDY